MTLAIASDTHGATAAADPSPTTLAQRERYLDALADLRAGRLAAFDAQLEALADYPLLPYLHYARLMRYLSRASAEDMEGFRTRFADTPLADRALAEWLDSLARRGDWAAYRAHFDPTVARSTSDRCYWYRSLLATGDRAAAFDGARELWVVGHSQPKACDPLFAAWQNSGGVTDPLAWERLRLALAAGRTSLGSYVLRFLAPDSRVLAETFIGLHRQPERLERLDRIDADPERAREIVVHVLRRLARQDPDTAEREYGRWATRVALRPAERTAIRLELVRARTRRDAVPADLLESWPPPELTVASAADVVEELARHAVGKEDWRQLRGWIERMPEALQQSARWQYWRARAEIALGEAEITNGPLARTSGARTTEEGDPRTGPSALATAFLLPPDDLAQQGASPRREASTEERLVALAGQRNFYGFLAADLLGVPFALNDAGIDVREDELAAVAADPAVRRAFELHALEEDTDARREMAWISRRLDERRVLVLAELARRAEWHRESIQATISGALWDHLELRFPLAFAEPMVARARANDLQPSWLFAVARQESAFMTDARSRAGALGLMQLMPQTARMTARRSGIPYSNTWQLLDYEKNIEIGSSYLREMYERFGRNRILASAAYNAGPTRVDRWLSERPSAPADVWIEAIPFSETRGYVQNVLAYSVIYGERMGLRQPLLLDAERRIQR
jgi:soluble lytic murein transglycosylase